MIANTSSGLPRFTSPFTLGARALLASITSRAVACGWLRGTSCASLRRRRAWHG
jgi:hypothetical protein